MTGNRSGPNSPLAVHEKIIFALDVATLEEARHFVSLFRGRVGLFKVGLEFFMAYGPEAVLAVREAGGDVFLDLKLHDIPNTVGRAAEEAVKWGVRMFNLHASGGVEMMQATARRCRQLAEKLNRPRPIILAVTLLTSLDEENLKEMGWAGPIADRVAQLATLAREAGVDGVVASPREIIPIRQRCGPQFVIVTPGIRPAFAPTAEDDQKRVLTAREAIAAGADYIVIGRPVRLAPDPSVAMDQLIAEIG